MSLSFYIRLLSLSFSYAPFIFFYVFLSSFSRFLFFPSLLWFVLLLFFFWWHSFFCSPFLSNYFSFLFSRVSLSSFYISFLFLSLSSLSGCFIFFLILQFSVSWPFPSPSLVYTFVISWILFLSSLSPVVLLLSSLSIWSLCFSFSLTFFPLFIYLLYRSLPSLAPALIHPHTSSFFNLPLMLSSFFFVIKILLFQELMHFLLQV